LEAARCIAPFRAVAGQSAQTTAPASFGEQGEVVFR
jgi:hypothetical protein